MKKLFRITAAASIIGILAVLIINWSVNNTSSPYIYSTVKEVPPCYTAIVLGAKVKATGEPSDILKDRLDVAIELYKEKKVTRFLLTGDHGRKNYDEVNNMKAYLLAQGINTEDIFLDHAGFDTYNSMVRAKEIFNVNDAVVVTQEFHLSRAVYIARSKGLNAVGIAADRHTYRSIGYLEFRESIANVKAFLEVTTNKEPHFLGESIPITGDSKLSYD